MVVLSELVFSVTVVTTVSSFSAFMATCSVPPVTLAFIFTDFWVVGKVRVRSVPERLHCTSTFLLPQVMTPVLSALKVRVTLPSVKPAFWRRLLRVDSTLALAATPPRLVSTFSLSKATQGWLYTQVPCRESDWRAIVPRRLATVCTRLPEVEADELPSRYFIVFIIFYKSIRIFF